MKKIAKVQVLKSSQNSSSRQQLTFLRWDCFSKQVIIRALQSVIIWQLFLRRMEFISFDKIWLSREDWRSQCQLMFCVRNNNGFFHEFNLEHILWEYRAAAVQGWDYNHWDNDECKFDPVWPRIIFMTWGDDFDRRVRRYWITK